MELLFYKYNVCYILAQCFHGFQRTCLMLRVVLHPKWISNSPTPVGLRGAVKSSRFLFHEEQWFLVSFMSVAIDSKVVPQKNKKNLKHWVNKYMVWTFTLFLLLDFVWLVIMTNIFKLLCSCSRHRWLWPCWNIFEGLFKDSEGGWVDGWGVG